MNAKSDRTTKAIRRRQKPADRPTGDRVTDARTLRAAQNLAEKITQRYPLRTWALRTSRQNHGWWSHVVAGRFEEVRFTQADLADLKHVWRGCEDERMFDRLVLIGLDQIEHDAGALIASVRGLREQLRRKAKAIRRDG